MFFSSFLRLSTRAILLTPIWLSSRYHVSATTSSASSSPTTPISPLSSGSFALTATVTLAPSPSGNYSPSALDELWSMAGSVQPPSISTTVDPALPIVLPSPPPPLYPSFYSPSPAHIQGNLSFPKNFMFGVASSAYQVEGAVKDEGRGPAIWDALTKIPGIVADNSSADVVGLHYYLYKEDIARIAALGFKAHSFSISWPRIYPFGSADSPVNQKGVDHCSDVINYHLSMGVEPVVTLFHFDIPLALQLKYGGISSSNFVDDFVNYAKTVFKAYNGRVKRWFTFNEPHQFCLGLSQVGPVLHGANTSATADLFHCAYNFVLAHAATFKAFRAMNISGEIAFKNDGVVGIPWRSNTTEDQDAVERSAAFYIGIYSDPIYVSGDWPQLVKDTLDPSILPRFTDQQIKDNKGTADFFAIDLYTTQYIRAPAGGISACLNDTANPSWPTCAEAVDSDTNGWAIGPFADPATSYIVSAPQFLRQSLKEMHKRWPSKSMMISEFGFSEPSESQRTELSQIKEDSGRTNYLLTNLGETLLSIHEDGIPLTGAFTWAIMDNFEWLSGLSVRFGIQYVNYTTLERSFKRSAFALSEFYQGHGL